MRSEGLGARIRAFREKQEISREELAGRAGVSAELIAHVEEEDLYPSLGPLVKIARGLGVRLGTFMDDVAVTDPLVVRKTAREEELAMRTARDASASLKFFSLGKGKADRHMEPFYVEIGPEPEEEKELSSHEGEEFMVVTSGEIRVTYGDEVHTLTEGDSIYMNSIVPHHVGLGGGETATIYAVVYFPM